MKRLFRILVIIFLGLTLGACDIIQGFLPSTSSSAKPEYTITLDKESLELDIDESYTLDVNFSKEVEDKTITWESSNTSVASVSNDGLVSGIKAGQTTITVTSTNNQKATCIVTVYDIIQSVEIINSYDTIYYGDVIELQASIYPENVKDKTLKWTLEETNLATLNNNILTTLP